MAFNQIDTGVPGDPSTGDSIHDGGNKINEMFSEIYEKTAPSGQDFRMTGYWIPDSDDLVDLSSPVIPGFKIDVDTSLSTKTVDIGGDQSYSKGDEIQLRDVSNTWDTAPVSIRTVGGGTINSKTTQVIRSRGAIVTLTCEDSSSNIWSMKVESMFGRDDNIADVRGVVTSSTDLEEVLYDSNNATGIKIVISGVDDSDPTRKTISEILVTDDGSQVFSTEYAVLNTDGDSLFSVTFDYIANQAVAVVSTSEASVTIRIKTMEFIDV